ncbi:hypothetical protein D3C85_1618080 [compost metagenome]
MPEGLSRHLLRALAWEQNINRHAVQQPRSSVFQVILNPVHRLFAKRHQPFLIPFTNHPHHALTQADVAHRQTDQFRHAQPGGIQHFKHGFIA